MKYFVQLCSWHSIEHPAMNTKVFFSETGKCVPSLAKCMHSSVLCVHACVRAHMRAQKQSLWGPKLCRKCHTDKISVKLFFLGTWSVREKCWSIVNLCAGAERSALIKLFNWRSSTVSTLLFLHGTCSPQILKENSKHNQALKPMKLFSPGPFSLQIL